VVGGVDAQQLLADAPERVARDVEREQPRRPDPPVVAEPDEERGQPEVPDDLVEERGVERRVVQVARGAVGPVDLEPASQDIVYVSTVFSSLLDPGFQERLAGVMWRWLRPGRSRSAVARR